MEVRVAHRLLRRFQLTSVPAVRIPSQIQKRIKTKDGFWRPVPLLVTGSVDTGEPLAPPGPSCLAHPHYSENLVALRAPSTSRCDFCQVSFCGIGIPERCYASSLRSQHLNGFSDLGDLIQAADIYECFEGNTVEVDILFDYLTEHRMTPKQIYQEVRAPRALRPETPNHLPRSFNTFRTPLSNSHRCSTRSSSRRSMESPEVSIPTQLHLVRISADGAPLRSSCGVSVTGGSERGRRAGFRPYSLTNRIALVENPAETRKIQVRRLPPLNATDAHLDMTQITRESVCSHRQSSYTVVLTRFCLQSII